MKLTLKDLQDAEREYSEYALQALLGETQPFIPDMSNLLMGFMDKRAVLTEGELTEIFAQSGISGNDHALAIKYLIEANFLGLQIGDENYRFALTPQQTSFMLSQATKYRSRQNILRTFKVHKAFHKSLDIRA